MDDTELVSSIINNVDIVEYIGQYTELKQKGDNFFGLCMFHEEVTASFSVNPAAKKYYCFGCGCGGNVITFSAKINRISFDNAALRLASELNIDTVKKQKSPTVAILKQLAKDVRLPEVERQPLDPSELDKYTKATIRQWEAEGIPQFIINKYGVRIDVQSNRIVYPVYDNNGNLINIKGRTMFEDYKSMRIPKYINYYKVGTVDYLQGYYMKKHLISAANEIIIFEGIKSCMKADSYGYYNSVSCETHKLNPFQIKFLIGLRCDIVIAFDKDVDFKKILDNVSMLKRFANVFIVRDTKDLLEKKDSPVDKGKEIWEKLYYDKIRV